MSTDAATITARQPLPLCMISLAGLGLTSGSRIDDTLAALPSSSGGPFVSRDRPILAPPAGFLRNVRSPARARGWPRPRRRRSATVVVSPVCRWPGAAGSRSRWSAARPPIGPERRAAAASRAARSRAFTAAGPSPPLSDRGSPTSTSIGSCSATSSASRASSVAPAGTVASGYASTPSRSQAATPIRASPQSIASRTPRLIRSHPARHAPRSHVCRRVRANMGRQATSDPCFPSLDGKRGAPRVSSARCGRWRTRRP